MSLCVNLKKSSCYPLFTLDFTTRNYKHAFADVSDCNTNSYFNCYDLKKKNKKI